MALPRTAVHLITGATGSGKTSLIRSLLAKRPNTERWAVLSNDPGPATLGTARGVAEGEVVVREVGGCMCCTGQVVLRAALVSLLRDARPERVLIEASAAAEPSSLRTVLDAPPLASALDLRPTVALVSATQLGDPRYRDANVYREQIRAADVVVVTMASRPDERERHATRAALAELVSTGTRIVEVAGAVDLSLIDRARA